MTGQYITYKEVNCYGCGLLFAVEESFLDARIEQERTIHCPGCGYENTYYRAKKDDDAKAEPADVVSLKRQLAQALHQWEQSEARIAELQSPKPRKEKARKGETA